MTVVMTVWWLYDDWWWLSLGTAISKRSYANCTCRTRFSYLILQISSFCAAQLCKSRTSGMRPLSNSDDFLAWRSAIMWIVHAWRASPIQVCWFMVCANSASMAAWRGWCVLAAAHWAGSCQRLRPVAIASTEDRIQLLRLASLRFVSLCLLSQLCPWAPRHKGRARCDMTVRLSVKIVPPTSRQAAGEAWTENIIA